MKQIKRLQIGKKGLTQEFIEQVNTMFKHEKVIKISILKSACRDKKEAEGIAKEIVNALGKRFDYKLVGYVLTIIRFRKDQR
ncbi:MAG: YhbY family RNA-binding protein [archaeon]|nr:YhbY family RNA-binding protein [archaeon]MCR4323370.1 YhbY family RNA-binding protein [Nanoarchaeota archaeon]